jgi:hypothetical protein
MGLVDMMGWMAFFCNVFWVDSVLFSGLILPSPWVGCEMYFYGIWGIGH